jgi:hypothetical protein
MQMGIQSETHTRDNLIWHRLRVFGVSAIYTWLMIVGLWGGFLYWFRSESAIARYLADASYWVYLASLTPILLFQYLVQSVPLHGIAKFTVVLLASSCALLISYHYLIRYTMIGTILNGPRYRPRTDTL